MTDERIQAAAEAIARKRAGMMGWGAGGAKVCQVDIEYAKVALAATTPRALRERRGR